MNKKELALLLGAFARAVVNDDMDAFRVVERRLDEVGLSWAGYVGAPVFYRDDVPLGQVVFHYTTNGQYRQRKPYSVRIEQERRKSPTEGIDGFHNQIGGYSCPACHDQGCSQCMDSYQLHQ
jgi:hypothetical protein